MGKTSPAKFIREVRNEGKKVVWPTRREALTSTVMVLVMASLMALFFLLVDQGLSWAIRLILG